MRADPHIGLLHRATEKLARDKTWIQALPYMDRLDLHVHDVQRTPYCLASSGCWASRCRPAQYIRVMFDEITRLLNHLLVDRRRTDVAAR